MNHEQSVLDLVFDQATMEAMMLEAAEQHRLMSAALLV
jgi:hypothetical protein